MRPPAPYFVCQGAYAGALFPLSAIGVTSARKNIFFPFQFVACILPAFSSLQRVVRPSPDISIAFFTLTNSSIIGHTSFLSAGRYIGSAR